MSLKIYNTLSRSLETFTPVNPPKVGVYVCGPTVYGHSHLGHAKSYISFDVIVRWLKARGYDVSYVQNITDVGHLTDDADEGEDKIIAEARRRGLHPMAVVETFLASYLEDMDALNVARPDIMPRATGHIPEQIAAAMDLIERGAAYEANGAVYFSVEAFKEYGKLSNRRVEEMTAGARVAVNSEKRHPADFALWKRADASHIMQWPSPWGPGYPGWHLECSVMAQKYLGTTVDIHGGGLENQFPHHECEIAQAEAATGQPFVKYWMHNNMVTLNGQKMGKSLGNAISLKQIFWEGTEHLSQRFEPVVVRHFILTSHYRQTLDFSDAALKSAESGSYKLRDALAAVAQAAEKGSDSASPSEEVRDVLDDTRTRFEAALDDDFNTAQAIATLFELVKHANRWIQSGSVGRADLTATHELLRGYACDVLGFDWPTNAGASGGAADERDALIGLLVDLRKQARADKNFALSDTIRDRLTELDVHLKDGPDGTTW